MLFKKLVLNPKTRDMNYYILKNGKAIKRYKNKERALLFAMNDLEYDSVDDCVAVVNSNGDYIWEP